MRNGTRKWLHGLIGGTIGGGANSASIWLGMAGAKAAGMDVPALNLQSLGVIFAIGSLGSALLYLRQSPIPPDDDLGSAIRDLSESLADKADTDDQLRASVLKKDQKHE